VLAVVAAEGDELVEDTGLLAPQGAHVARECGSSPSGQAIYGW
jgi:hypothetical protein